MSYWMLCDQYGNQLCDGLAEHEYARVAQETADRLGFNVYAHRSDSSAPPGMMEAPEMFEPE